MKKILISGAVLFSVFILFCYMFWFYCFKYPQNVTYSAHESVENGKEVWSLFDVNHEFMKSNNKSSHPFLQFSSDDKTKECPYVRITKTNAMILTDKNKEMNILWTGNKNDLGTSLKNFQKDLVVCEKLCATFMPAYVYRGSFCIHYDKNLKITGKEKPVFWD